MKIRRLALLFAIVLVVSTTHAATNSLFISANVMTGQTWHAATNVGNGTGGSCSITSNVVEYYSAPFFTDQTAGTYSLHVNYPSAQAGFIYLYRDTFDPANPCYGILAFGLAPTVNISGIHLDANRQYYFVTSEALLYGGEGSFQVTVDGPEGCHLFSGNGQGTPVAFCFGDGFDANVTTSCPCGNFGTSGRGCNNSVGTGGALLSASGTLAPDTLVLHVSGELPNTLSVFLQGSTILSSGLPFGEGIRCIGGSLMRIGIKTSNAGATTYPEAGDPHIRQTSENHAGAIPSGAIRYYQVYYRDPSTTFCPNIPGNSWNVSNGLRVTWP